jgi:hypothetical protein
MRLAEGQKHRILGLTKPLKKKKGDEDESGW